MKVRDQWELFIEQLKTRQRRPCKASYDRRLRILLARLDRTPFGQHGLVEARERGDATICVSSDPSQTLARFYR